MPKVMNKSAQKSLFSPARLTLPIIVLIAKFDDSKGWSGGGTVKSCAHRLNWKCGIAMGAASHVEQLVSKYKRVKKSMEGQAEQDRDESRELVYYQDEEGMWIIKARLSPEAGSLLVKAIEALVKPVMQEKRSQLLERKRQAKENVSAETPRRLSCDAALTTVLEDESGNILNIGRRARTIPTSIRRALDVRDKTCRFPGCCESRHVEGHHIEYWADGGGGDVTERGGCCFILM